MKRMRLLSKLFVSALFSTAVAGSTLASAQTITQQDAQEALRQAMEARERARQALEAADRAIAAAEQSLGTPPVAVRQQDPVLPNIRVVGIEPVSDAASHFCSDPGEIREDVSRFELQCLGLGKWSDFSSTNLNIALIGNLESGVIEIGPSYTYRSRAPADRSYRSSYVRIAPTFRAAVGSGTSTASFLDVDEFELAESGLGASLSLEWGRNFLPLDSGPNELATLTRGLAQAQRECVADMLAREAAGQAQDVAPTGQALQDERQQWHADWRAADDRIAPSAPCTGERLARWMRHATRNNGYFKTLVRPLWGYDASPQFFAGITASYAHNDYSYFPLSDPGMTGVPVIPTLPDNFPEGATVQSEDLYAIRAYAGRGFRTERFNGTIAGSIAYRREFNWAEGTQNQQICAPPGTLPGSNPNVVRCFSRNIAAPFATEGLHAGVHFKTEFRWGFLPAAAIAADLTYAFDEEQFRLKLPFYFISGSDGIPNGGVILECRSGGETRAGTALEDECSASLFVSSSFRLGAR